MPRRPWKAGSWRWEKVRRVSIKSSWCSLQKYQVIGLAVAFVIGTAATKLVNSTVSDIIMPIIAVIIPGGNWREAVFQVGPIQFLLGDFVGAIIDFVIIALVIFIIVKYIMKGDISKKSLSRMTPVAGVILI